MSPFYNLQGYYVNLLNITAMHIQMYPLTVGLHLHFIDGKTKEFPIDSEAKAKEEIEQMLAIAEALHSPQFFADPGTRFEPAGSPMGIAYVTPWAERVKKWAEDRNIIGGSTPFQQYGKLSEEVRELRDHLIFQEDKIGGMEPDQLRVAIADDIGDCVVVLRIIAALCNLDWETCLEQAWDDIKHRKGKLINGVFVKEQ